MAPLFDAFCAPFITGYHQIFKNGQKKGTVYSQDGHISTLQMIILLLAVAGALSFGARFSTQEPNMFSLKVCMSVLLSLCCVMIMVFLCAGNCQKVSSSGSDVTDERVETSHIHIGRKYCKQLTKKFVPIIGMVLFVSGAVVMDIMHIIGFSFCIGTGKPEVYIFYHTMKIIFLLLVCTLCGVLTNRDLSLKRQCLSRYILSSVVVMVVWIALEAQLQESQDLFHIVNQACYFSINLTANGSKTTAVPTEIPAFARYDGVSVYLYPFIIEYCLLVAECICHHLFDMEKLPDVEDNTGSPDCGGSEEARPLLSDATGQSPDGNSEGYNTMTNDHDEQRIITYSRSESAASLIGGTTNRGHSTNRILSHIKVVSFLISLFLGIIYLVFPSYATVNSKDESYSVRFTMTYYVYKIVYRVILIVCTKVGFYHAHFLKSKHNGYSGYEMLVLISSFGQFTFISFSIIADIANISNTDKTGQSSNMISNTTSTTIAYLICILLAIYQVFSQTTFMLHAAKLACVSDKAKRGIHNRMVKCTLIFLATTNFLMWVLESFVEIKDVNRVFPVQVGYYGKSTWSAFSAIIFPLMLFYRFNSAILMIGTYLTI